MKIYYKKHEQLTIVERESPTESAVYSEMYKTWILTGIYLIYIRIYKLKMDL